MQSKYKSHAIIIAVLLLLALYEHGIRIVDLGEMPSSKRPVSILIAGRE